MIKVLPCLLKATGLLISQRQEHSRRRGSGIWATSCHVVLLALGLAVSSTAAGRAADNIRYGPWRHSIIGGGGYIQNVVLCPSDPQRAYCYVDNSGIFRSDDAGRSWRIIHGTMPVSFGIYDVRGLSVDPRNADKLVAAIGTQWDKPWGIFVSEDGGASWKQTLHARFFGGDEYRYTGFILQRNPANPNELAAASGMDGFFRSSDNGQSWRSLGLTNVYATDLKYDYAFPQRLWLCALNIKLRAGSYHAPIGGGFYRSDNGGTTWQKLSERSPSEIIQDPANPVRLYGIFDGTHLCLSTNAGQSWSEFGEGLTLADKGKLPGSIDEHRYEALTSGPDFVLTASSKGTFYKLACGENRWQKITPQSIEETLMGAPWFASRQLGVQGHFGSALGSITVDPKQPTRWFCTDFYGVYQTTNAGQDWFLSSDGIDATVLFSLAQDPGDPGVVHLGMADNGHFLSTDGGVRFVRFSTGNQNMKCISVAPSLPSRVYGIGSGLKPELAGSKSVQVYVSTDRGRTWIESPMLGLPNMATRCACSIEVDPRNPYVAWVGVSGPIAPGGGGVYQTVDGGKTWHQFGTGLPEGKWYFRPHLWNIGREIAAGADGSLVVFGSGGTYYFEAGSQRWLPAKVQPPGSPNEVVADLHHPGRFYIASEGDGGIARSDDGGVTWARVFRSNCRHVAVDSAKENRLAAGTTNGVVLSTDGGATWPALDARLPYRFQPLVCFAGERLLAGTVGNGCFWIPLSPAGENPALAKANSPAYCTELALRSSNRLTDDGQSLSSWTVSGATGATARIFRDQAARRSGSAPLCAYSDQPREVIFSKLVSVPPGSMEQAWLAGGWLRSAGNLKNAHLSVYCTIPGQPGAWRFVATAPQPPDWLEFSQALNIPKGTEKVRLQLVLTGPGKVWLDGLNIAPAQVWKDAPAK